MDDIANEADVSRDLLYVYFKDKKDIYRSLRIRSVQILHNHLSDGVDLSTEGIEQVRQIGEAFYGFYKNKKKHFDCLSLDISLNNQNNSLKQEAKEDSEAMKIEYSIMKIMVDAIETRTQDGSIDSNKAPSPVQTAVFLGGCMHGVILL